MWKRFLKTRCKYRKVLFLGLLCVLVFITFYILKNGQNYVKSRVKILWEFGKR